MSLSDDSLSVQTDPQEESLADAAFSAVAVGEAGGQPNLTAAQRGAHERG